MDVLSCLKEMVARNASDLHLVAGSPPAFRSHGDLDLLTDMGAVSEEDLKKAYSDFLTEEQKQKFEQEQELDYALEKPEFGRLRGNVAIARGKLCLTFRRVGTIDLDLDALGLPPICKDLTSKRTGLVIVTGAAGSGKSTTLAAMIEYLNRRVSKRIWTLEDPIEYVFSNKKSVISQRQIGEDSHSFRSALDHILRQNPDVIMVGEFRDAATVAAALTASETGHLVLTTGHAPTAPQTIDRIINLFAAEQQTEVRAQLASVLEAVIYQALLPKRDGQGRVLASEVMLGTVAVRNLIRARNIHQLPSAIKLGYSQGMMAFDDSVLELHRKGLITTEVAHSAYRDRQVMESAMNADRATQATEAQLLPRPMHDDEKSDEDKARHNLRWPLRGNRPLPPLNEPVPGQAMGGG